MLVWIGNWLIKRMTQFVDAVSHVSYTSDEREVGRSPDPPEGSESARLHRVNRLNVRIASARGLLESARIDDAGSRTWESRKRATSNALEPN